MQIFLKIIQTIINKLKAPLKEMIYSEAFSLAILKLPWVPTWIMKTSLKWALNKSVNPAIDKIVREINFEIEVIDGSITYKKINNAANVNDWNDNIDAGM